MTNKEVNLRSILFLVVGILLLLSLVICIYIVHRDSDLVKIGAEVIDVKKDSDGTGKNDVTVVYDVGSTSYKYNFYYRDEVNVEDTIDIYYHKNNPSNVQTFKTGKYIFICPILGLVLCVIGLYELLKKDKDDDGEEDFKTQVISVVGDTQQLKIITDEVNEEMLSYKKTPEEEMETQVKAITSNNIAEKPLTRGEVFEKFIDNHEDLDKMIEPHEEVKIEQVRTKIIPSSFYISGKTIVYEVPGQETEEINLVHVRKIVKTINHEDKVIKIVVYTDDLQCILTQMKNINLEEIANLLHNKMLSLDENFEEEVEYKEY